MRDYKAWGFDDEDPSKYWLNYLDDDSENHQEWNTNSEIGSPEDSGDVDVSTLPNDLIVTPVLQELFTDQQLKVIFSFRYLLFTYDLFALERRNSSNYFVVMILKSLFSI